MSDQAISYEARVEYNERIRRKNKNRRRRRILGRVILLILAVIVAIEAGTYLGNVKYKHDIKTYSVDGNAAIVKVATSQATTANKSGNKFWSWYGYNSYVPWCATFVSWCENQVGDLSNGKGVKYADCVQGVAWFKSHGKWLKGGETPKAGDVIFFDWEQDGNVDHTGIVTGVVKDNVFTVEGNSSDRCRRKRYKVDNPVILGYGELEKSN